MSLKVTRKIAFQITITRALFDMLSISEIFLYKKHLQCVLANTRFISMAECNNPLPMHWSYCRLALSHWYTNSLRLSRETHICVSDQTIMGSNNGLSPGRRQAIIWTNTGIGSLGIHFSAFLREIQIFSFKKVHLNESSAKSQPFLSRPQCVKPQYPISTVYSFYLLCDSFSSGFCRVLITATGLIMRLCPSRRSPLKDGGHQIILRILYWELTTWPK